MLPSSTHPASDHVLPPEKAVSLIAARTAEYLAVPSVVGHERHFFEYLRKDYERAGLSVIAHDGLLEVHGKNPLSAILTAHIDRHGLISIGHGEFVYAAQYVKEIKYGQNNRASQKEIENISRRFEGEEVYAYEPTTGAHVGMGTIRACEPWLQRGGDALFDTTGLEDVELGLPAAYARTARVENGYLKGQLDNAISVAVINALFSSGYQGTALLTAEEEIGKSWVHAAAWLMENALETRHLLVLDTSPYAENGPIDEGMVIFRSRDMWDVFNADLLEVFKKRASELGLPYQVKDEMLRARGKSTEQLGSTELGRLIREANGVWSGATAQIPTLMYHTSNETTSLKAIDHYFRFLHDILIARPLDLSARAARKKS